MIGVADALGDAEKEGCSCLVVVGSSFTPNPHRNHWGYGMASTIAALPIATL